MIILEGGIGSEMDMRSGKTTNKDPTWCACHHTSNPIMPERLYEEFVVSGSQMLSVNTYSILQYLLNVNEIQTSVERAVCIVEKVRKLYPHIIIAG